MSFQGRLFLAGLDFLGLKILRQPGRRVVGRLLLRLAQSLQSTRLVIGGRSRRGGGSCSDSGRGVLGLTQSLQSTRLIIGRRDGRSRRRNGGARDRCYCDGWSCDRRGRGLLGLAQRFQSARLVIGRRGGRNRSGCRRQRVGRPGLGAELPRLAPGHPRMRRAQPRARRGTVAAGTLATCGVGAAAGGLVIAWRNASKARAWSSDDEAGTAEAVAAAAGWTPWAWCRASKARCADHQATRRARARGRGGHRCGGGPRDAWGRGGGRRRLLGLAQSFQSALLIIGRRGGRSRSHRGILVCFARLLFRFRGCLGRLVLFGLMQGLKGLGLFVRAVGGAVAQGCEPEADRDTKCHRAEFSVSHFLFLEHSGGEINFISLRNCASRARAQGSRKTERNRK